MDLKEQMTQLNQAPRPFANCPEGIFVVYCGQTRGEPGVEHRMQAQPEKAPAHKMFNGGIGSHATD